MYAPVLKTAAADLVLRGPLYTIARLRSSCPKPLDPDTTWDFWTSARLRVLQSLLLRYPPAPLRERFLRRQLTRTHQSGIAEHYDLSFEFYRSFLDRKFMFYSCADFISEHETLEAAQRNKAEFLLQLIDPQPGEAIHELGCGWGGMLRYLKTARRKGLKATGCTLSREQFRCCRSLGLDVSYSDFINTQHPPSAYHKIYSIGSMEHVRPDEIQPLFTKLYAALKPGGRLVQHFFGFTTPCNDASMVLAQLFFPGSLLSTCEQHIRAARHAGFRLIHDSQHDYRPTLRAWFQRLVQNRDTAIRAAGVQAFNRFLNFFPISWRLFDLGSIGVHRLVLVKE